MKLTLLIILSVSCLISAHAQQWIDKQYEYDSILNIHYGSAVNFNGSSTDLFMDVYTPQCDQPGEISQWPMIVFIHGGAFIAGSKDDASIQQWCKSFAKRGYVTASISYRLGFVSDDTAWTCNFPNYECLFATETAEWIRAYYRGIQDTKGAIRYLVNRNSQFSIDTNNVFLAGESAGAFIALGAGLMDDPSERPGATFAIADAPIPNSTSAACPHNSGVSFTTPINRPDLGSIQGSIEPSGVDYTVKAIGNFYGGMFGDLLQVNNASKPKPGIYSYHQQCDLIVGIDSREVFWGLDWCMVNGYGCYAIANTPVAHGSETFANWNLTNGYNYTINEQYSGSPFPYNFAFGTGSCLDQANNPCHAIDNRSLRDEQLAQFFESYVSSSQICETAGNLELGFKVEVYPNPASSELKIVIEDEQISEIEVYNLAGEIDLNVSSLNSSEVTVDIQSLSNGTYISHILLDDGQSVFFRFVKNN